MELKDWLSVLAVLLFPLIALQVSKALDEQRERRKRKMWVFYTLMATRNARVSAEHVRAVNSIDIEFTRDKSVTLAWKAYLDHLNDKSQEIHLWGQESDDLFVELLFVMGGDRRRAPLTGCEEVGPLAFGLRSPAGVTRAQRGSRLLPPRELGLRFAKC